MKPEKKDNDQKPEIESLENDQDAFDFGGLPSDISLTKNIGCAADSKSKEQTKKWKEAE